MYIIAAIVYLCLLLDLYTLFIERTSTVLWSLRRYKDNESTEEQSCQF